MHMHDGENSYHNILWKPKTNLLRLKTEEAQRKYTIRWKYTHIRTKWKANNGAGTTSGSIGTYVASS